MLKDKELSSNIWKMNSPSVVCDAVTTARIPVALTIALHFKVMICKLFWEIPNATIPLQLLQCLYSDFLFLQFINSIKKKTNCKFCLMFFFTLVSCDVPFELSLNLWCSFLSFLPFIYSKMSCWPFGATTVPSAVELLNVSHDCRCVCAIPSDAKIPLLLSYSSSLSSHNLL